MDAARQRDADEARADLVQRARTSWRRTQQKATRVDIACRGRRTGDLRLPHPEHVLCLSLL